MTTTDYLPCPECGAPAEVVDRMEINSCRGLVPHVRLLCVKRCVYFGPEVKT